MNHRKVAGLIVGAMFALSACSTIGAPKPVGTVTTKGTAQAAKPAGTAVNQSALPAGGDVNLTPAVTDTAPLTPTATITPATNITLTTDITPTVDITSTVEVTPTDAMTNTPTTTDKTNSTLSEATDVKTLTTKGQFNVRSGPSATFRVVGFARRGETLEVLGVSKDKRWWKIKCLSSNVTSCWISANARYLTPNK